MSAERELANLRAEVECLKRRINQNEDRIVLLEKWLGTVCSLPWKRLWWLLQGYRWYELGRWRE